MPGQPFFSIFNDVIGPVMRGPSSSHTAGSHRHRFDLPDASRRKTVPGRLYSSTAPARTPKPIGRKMPTGRSPRASWAGS